MAIIPSREALIEPENHPPADREEPQQNYVLEYVYGYKMDHSSMNCLYLASGKVVFYAAALGIVMDPAENTQSFFGGQSKPGPQHNNRITCMAVDQDKKLVATGQLGRYPTVYIWDPETLSLKTSSSKIGLGEKKYFPQSISALAFSADGKYIAVADTSEEHKVYTFTVDEHEEKYSGPSQVGHVKAIAWSRSKDDYLFCTVGKKSVKFWYPLDETKTPLLCKLPSMGMTTDFFCVVFDNSGVCYTGGANGYIYTWDSSGSTPSQVQAHQGVVYALNYIPETNQLISGGADEKACIYSLPDLRVVNEFSFHAAVISVDYQREPERLLAGLADGQIVQIEVDQENYYQLLMEGHSDGYLTALDVVEDNVITAGEDNKIIVWSYNDHSAFITTAIDKNADKVTNTGNQSKYPDNQRCKLLTVNRVNNHIALAISNGSIQVREGCYTPENLVFKGMVAEGKQITALKYSFDGEKLAVAINDGNIHLFDCSTEGEYNLIGVMGGGEGYIVDMDWSTDGGCMRGMTNQFHVYFFDPIGVRLVDISPDWTKSLEWVTNSVKLTWSTEGIYPKGCDGEHIRTVTTTNKKDLIVTGDAYNSINLYRNPCRPGTKSKVLKGHASTIDCIGFSPDDTRMFSVAGKDRCLMQWKFK
eukprot:TRINITY_DN3928_c0_g1_i1.p1 TRINITY_DN3928_c0_g1~~TRINITY_DN3928_c0_g1_i1.p1  ORF type:complete len:645 (-),score=143.95 TRINITY_DN3928_c0_g1_i1:148-2082(-)